MRLMKFGKTLLMSAISAGVILGITSCVQSYTVGYLYVTGTSNAAASNNGIISGFKIDHNKGSLVPINGLPVSSGGANPGRAVLLNGGQFLYVLNRGKNAEGTPNCTAADPCTGANITQFAVGGNGVLSPRRPSSPRASIRRVSSPIPQAAFSTFSTRSPPTAPHALWRWAPASPPAAISPPSRSRRAPVASHSS